MVECIQAWSRHLYLGNGVVLETDGKSQGLSQISMDTWLEMGVESGILGIMAFIFALLATMREALIQTTKSGFEIFVLGAWVSHFLVSLNFTQTFPRLDYWLIFFVSISLLMPGLPMPRFTRKRLTLTPLSQ
jgi:hypothetical protein